MAKGVEEGKDVSSWGEVIDAEEVNAPIVFHFKPTKFVRVADDRLRDWEQYFVENVGFAPPAAEGLRPDPWAGSPGGSISGSNGGWDDCDI